jgi:tetratricopeptide (TPR) repeat protein
MKLCVGILLLAAVQAFSQDLLSDGKQALESGRPLDAIRSFRKALDSPSGRTLPSDGQHALLIALTTAYLDAGDLHGAEETLVEASRIGTSGAVSQAELENDWGSLLLKQGRLGESHSRFCHALELLSGNAEGKKLAPAVLNNLAAAEIRLGRYDQALHHQEEALARWAAFESPAHPDLIKGRASLATLEFLIGKPEDARLSMDLAIASARRTYGPNSGVLGDLLDSQTIILKKLGLKKEAKSAQAEARRIGGRQPKSAAPITWNAQEALVPPSTVHAVSK